MTVKIIADSTCDLSAELLEKYDISVLPLHILLDNVSYSDGIDIFPEMIFSWSDEVGRTPTTSAPSLAEAIDLFSDQLRKCDELVCFSISSEFSSCNNVMHMAAEEIDAEDRIHIIDSRSLGDGIGLLAIKASIMAHEGCNGAEIEKAMNELVDKVNVSFIVDNLTFLHRGGRCGGLAMMLGSTLQLHPKIVVEQGKMHSTRKYRGHPEFAIMSYVNDLADDLKKADTDRIFVVHSGCKKELINEVVDIVSRQAPFREIIVATAGGVISSHCGPGCLGIMFIEG